jgi:hypothetical protein
MRTNSLAIAAGIVLLAGAAVPASAQTPRVIEVPGVQSAPTAPEDAQGGPAQTPQDEHSAPDVDLTPQAQVPQNPGPDANPKAAENMVPRRPASRFTFSRVDGDFLRLDTMSGQVAICSQHAAGWACQAVPEDRAALEKEIARLQDEIASLKSELAALRAPPPLRPPAELAPPADKNGGAKIKLPTHEDIERARVAIESAWRRLVDMLVNLQKDMLRKG